MRGRVYMIGTFYDWISLKEGVDGYADREHLRALSSAGAEEKRRYVLLEIEDGEESGGRFFELMGVNDATDSGGILRRAVLLARENPELADQVTKRLYPELAHLFRKTYSCIEHRIRTAIDRSWQKAEPEMISMIFDSADGSVRNSRDYRPTGREYIRLTSSYLLGNSPESRQSQEK